MEINIPKFSSFWTSSVGEAEMILRVSVVQILVTAKLHCVETRPQPMFTLFAQISLFKQV